MDKQQLLRGCLGLGLALTSCAGQRQLTVTA